MADSDGHFRRQESAFRSSISREPGAEFPPENDRYYVYLSLGCPWAHRANIVRTLKGLESIITLVLVDHAMGPEGWYFSGATRGPPKINRPAPPGAAYARRHL